MVTNGVLILCCIGAFCLGWLFACLLSANWEGKKAENGKQRQIDLIRNMSVEELASFICGIYDYEYDSPIYNETENGKHICGDFIPDYDEDCIKQWLESEVTE